MSPKLDYLDQFYHKEYEQLYSSNDQTLAHYTTADALFGIVEKKAVWMRNARHMNDKREVEFSRTSFFNYMKKENGNRDFSDLINSIHSNSYDEVVHQEVAVANSIYNQTYLTCLSLHHKVDDRHGKLSMWRGYGNGTVPVTIVVNRDQVMGNGIPGINGNPVRYFDENGDWVKQFIELLKNHRTDLASQSKVDFVNQVRYFLFTMYLSIKHLGFSEEKEWRLFYLPEVYYSKLMDENKDIICFNGYPQTIYKIPLDGKSYNNGTVLSIDNLVDEIIIGPCSEPALAHDAIASLMQRENADVKVRCCDIPFRKNF